ncbi:MAG: hypothetical protein JWO95_345 [Verrucomicrobiales bacterium]|nr:hypothetical protein [Verrucomicrobiales bacterium]
MKRIFFTLASARSGTLFLRGVFQNNVRNCDCRHEPFFDWGNPTLFGPAIYDAYAGRHDRIRERLLAKKRYIDKLPGDIYLESSHAFLKSMHVAAFEVFPELELIHVVRDPLRVARSEAYREEWRRRVHAPFHFYKGDDGERHFCWSLTGNEEIFRHFESRKLTLFQWYLVQWIEIENRAMAFLRQHNLQERCYTLHSPRDLNDADKIRAMLKHFELPMNTEKVVLAGRRNQSFGYKANDTSTEELEFNEVVSDMPTRYLEIFRSEPYTNFGWANRLHRLEATSSLHHAH